ncbi:MAG: helix-turn-helix transcriptional regulator [Ruminococcus sp.]|nr:helix-turn-helix transcriptional regulator [Ruminococcus sp.]
MRMDETGFNHRHEKSFYIDRPEGTGDWLLLATKTKAVFRTDGRDVQYPANTFVIYTPGTPQYYRADGTEYIDDWIHFGPDKDEQQLMEKLGIPLNRPVSVQSLSLASDIIAAMCHEHYSSNQYRQESVDLYFRLLIYKLGEYAAEAMEPEGEQQSLYIEKLTWLRDCIYRWPSRDWNVDDMAAEASLSRSRLQHLYSETFGTSISKDIIASRMAKAEELLKDPELSIHDVAMTVGCSTASYFNRLFRSAYGKTPSEFRRELLNKGSGDN